MAIISTIVSTINKAIKSVVVSVKKGVQSVIEKTTQFGMKKGGFSTRDIVDTIIHSDIDAIADKLNQTTFTVGRMLDTEGNVMAFDKTKLLPRNLIVAAKLKSGRNYRYMFQADMLDMNGNMTGRKWFSMYANTQKAFSEVEEDITEFMGGQKYDANFTLGNISFHHVLHQRGAPFTPVTPR